MFGALRHAFGLGGGHTTAVHRQAPVNQFVQQLLQRRIAPLKGDQGTMGGTAGMAAGAGEAFPKTPMTPMPDVSIGPPPAPTMAAGSGAGFQPSMETGAGPAEATPEGWADMLNRRMRPPTPGL